MIATAAAPNIPENPAEVLARYARRFELLKAAEERELSQAYERGSLAAKQRMIDCNLRLVMKIARQYEDLSTLTLGELCNEGVVGLIRAVEKFDWRRGFKFSTYAVPWIRQAVQRAVFDRGAEIRVPIHVGQRQLKVRKVRSFLAAELGRSATDAEVARHTGFSEAEIAALDDISRVTCSIDAPVSSTDGGEELTLAGIIASEQPSPEREVSDSDWALRVRSLVDRLPSAQARALRAEFELAGDAGEEPKDNSRAARARRAELVKLGLARLAAEQEALALRSAA